MQQQKYAPKYSRHWLALEWYGVIIIFKWTCLRFNIWFQKRGILNLKGVLLLKNTYQISIAHAIIGLVMKFSSKYNLPTKLKIKLNKKDPVLPRWYFEEVDGDKIK